MKIKIAFLLIISILFLSALKAQPINPVKWTYTFEKTSETEGTLSFVAKIDKGYHIFSQFNKGGIGLPMVFDFKMDTTVWQRIGDVTEPEGKTEIDPYEKTTVKYFEGTVTFKQQIKILTKDSFKITGKLQVQPCQETVCMIPVETEFEFEVRQK